MVSLQILDEFTIKITEYLDDLEREIKLFENNDCSLKVINDELLQLCKIKKGFLNLILDFCLGKKDDKFIQQSLQKRISKYREIENLVRKYK